MITQEILKELLHYDQDTGEFAWRKRISNKVKAGSTAGWIDTHGYRQIGINGKDYQAHRLAWLYVNGVFPINSIDHINRVRTDNRISNLREATNQQNRLNSKIGKHNTSGFKGVSWHKSSGKWQARCQIDGKQKSIGFFETPKEASLAYEACASFVYGEFYYKHKQSTLTNG